MPAITWTQRNIKLGIHVNHHQREQQEGGNPTQREHKTIFRKDRKPVHEKVKASRAAR